VKEFLKSVSIWRRYGQKYGGMFFFESQCTITMQQRRRPLGLLTEHRWNKNKYIKTWTNK